MTTTVDQTKENTRPSAGRPKRERPANAEVQRAKTQFVADYRGNQIVIPITLVSPELQRIYRRHFDGLSRSLFFLRYYLGILRDGQVEQELFKEVANQFKEASESITQKNEVASRLLEETGFMVRAGVGRSIEAPIIDPYANDFLSLLVEADSLASKYSQLWLGRVLREEQYRQANNELSKSLRLVHSSISRLSLGVRDRVQGENGRDDGVEEATDTTAFTQASGKVETTQVSASSTTGTASDLESSAKVAA